MQGNSFYTDEELLSVGFKSIGKKCRISKYARFYGVSNISIGNNVRIDDFCIISGNIVLGNNIHISAYVSLYGANGIILEDYTGISARCTVYSAMDDFSGNYLVGPIHPIGTTQVTGGEVKIKKFAQIGAHSLLFPNLTIGEGCMVGAFSMVRHSLEPWGIYYGVPVSFHGKRKQKMVELIGKSDN